jgi:hypothetical protein
VPATDDLVQLIADLRTNAPLIAAFRANPANAVQNYSLTAHERDAVVTRDLDDFVALGVVAAISELPEVLRGGRREPGLILDRWLRLRLRLRNLLSRVAGPKIDLPGPPPPEPGPLPAPDSAPHPHPPYPRARPARSRRIAATRHRVPRRCPDGHC